MTDCGAGRRVDDHRASAFPARGRWRSEISRATASARSLSTRTRTEPPNPPPSSLAPYAPASSASSTSRSSSGDRDLVVVTKARVAREQERPGGGEVACSSAAANCRTRSFSVTTWRSRRAGMPSSAHVGELDRGRSLGADVPQRTLELGAARRRMRCLEASLDARVDDREHSLRGHRARAGAPASSSRAARPPLRARERWQPGRGCRTARRPLAARRAGRRARARAARAPSRRPRRAQAPTATSSAAEDESPAPAGRSDETVPSSPTGGRPSSGELGRDGLRVAGPAVAAAPLAVRANGRAAPEALEVSETGVRRPTTSTVTP